MMSVDLDASQQTSTFAFAVPQKRITSAAQLAAFVHSPTHALYVGFVERLSASVQGRVVSDPSAAACTTPAVLSMLAILARIQAVFDATPPEQAGKGRFGNPAFRVFFDKVAGELHELHRGVVPDEAIPEVSEYLKHSFGDRTRIDYGTGHEANFACWMLCFERLGLVGKEDYSALVLRVFMSYMKLMRNLQLSYWLEPAGSHGVWGLDDYHFLPFLWGAAQLMNHKHIKPKSIHDKDIVDEYSKDYMYLASIKFINEIKTASLRWHSPMLDDISGVKLWSKVNEGMIKMYRGEVLSKLPIMQHFLFGSIISFDIETEMGSCAGHDHSDAEHSHHHHIHEHHDHAGEANGGRSGPLVDVFGTAPTCCPRIPSAISARAMENNLRPIPFD